MSASGPYNRFSSRRELIDSVLPDLALRSLGAVMRRAEQQADPWERFVAYLEGMCELQAADSALNDVIARAYQGAGELSSACEESVAFGTRLIADAQAEGSLRADLTADDIVVVFWLNAYLTRTVATAAPDAWRRQLAIFLDGLRVDAATALPVAPDAVTAALPVMLGNRS